MYKIYRYPIAYIIPIITSLICKSFPTSTHNFRINVFLFSKFQVHILGYIGYQSVKFEGGVFMKKVLSTEYVSCGLCSQKATQLQSKMIRLKCLTVT